MSFFVTYADPHDAELFDAFTNSGIETALWDLRSPAPRTHIDAVFLPGYLDLTALSRLEKISTGLVQLHSIGFDGLPDNAPAGHVFANAAGVFEAPTAELAIAAMLSVLRGIPQAVHDQKAHIWRRTLHPGLAGASVLIVGAGGVGNAIADRLVGFDADVRRVARAARSDSRGHIHSMEELPQLLPEADVVVVVVPLNESTKGLINDSFLSGMHDDALLLNFARGPVADTGALLSHAHRLKLILDVTDPEPLPENHPLWEAAELILPHMGGASRGQFPLWRRLVRQQIDRLVAGQEPLNVVYRS